MLRRLLFACLLLLLALPAYAQDVVTFPALSGRYAVGSMMYPLVDESRDEIFTDDPADKRELLLTIYYPAEPFQGVQPVPYIDETLQAGLGVPAELVALIQTQVYGAMPISTPIEDTYPVLIFSPGMYSLPLFYSSLLAEVASHGYIVVAIWHPYSTALTVFPDGRALPVNAAGYLSPYSDAAEAEAATERIGNVWLADARFVLDQLATIEQLSGRINLTKVGIFGHSFGGGMAIEATYQDERLSAALNMDGPIFGEVIGQAIDKPVMIILADLWDLSISDEQLAETPGLTREAYEASLRAYINVYTAQNEAVLANAPTGYLVRVNNANHYTFATDMALLAPLFPNFFPIPPDTTMFSERSIEVIGAYIVAFFDEHLDQARPLLDSRNTTYPEVELEVFGSAD